MLYPVTVPATGVHSTRMPSPRAVAVTCCGAAGGALGTTATMFEKSDRSPSLPKVRTEK